MYKIKFSVGGQIISIYRSKFRNYPIRNRVYCADILRYQVTDLIWLGYHGHRPAGALRQNILRVLPHQFEPHEQPWLDQSSADMPPKSTPQLSYINQRKALLWAIDITSVSLLSTAFLVNGVEAKSIPC